MLFAKCFSKLFFGYFVPKHLFTKTSFPKLLYMETSVVNILFVRTWTPKVLFVQISVFEIPFVETLVPNCLLLACRDFRNKHVECLLFYLHVLDYLLGRGGNFSPITSCHYPIGRKRVSKSKYNTINVFDNKKKSIKRMCHVTQNDSIWLDSTRHEIH